MEKFTAEINPKFDEYINQIKIEPKFKKWIRDSPKTSANVEPLPTLIVKNQKTTKESFESLKSYIDLIIHLFEKITFLGTTGNVTKFVAIFDALSYLNGLSFGLDLPLKVWKENKAKDFEFILPGCWCSEDLVSCLDFLNNFLEIVSRNGQQDVFLTNRNIFFLKWDIKVEIFELIHLLFPNSVRFWQNENNGINIAFGDVAF